MKKRKDAQYKKAVMEAYSLLVSFRKQLEERGHTECAAEVEEVYKNLWCECLNEPAPWTYKV